MLIATRRLLPIVFATLLLAATAPGASAVTSTFPTQSLGDRGADVRAIQGLLKNHGFPVPIDGIFGQTTVDQVKAFQAAKGLLVSGIVWPSVWAKLTVTIWQGWTGETVRVVQRLLNEKRFARIDVTGYFGVATVAAVKTFQRHMGVAATGQVGPTTWRLLVWHYDYPAFTATTLCDYTDEGNGKAGNWGTGSAIGLVEAAAVGFAKSVRGRIAIGDLSLEHGGNIAGHATHEVGLDVDIRLIRVARNQCSFGTNWRAPSYDRAATRILIKAIRAAAPGHIKLIYFNDPVLINEGLTTWFTNHDDHLHVRYCEVSHADARYRC
jgi:Putative peptidoglycan binding domain/Penicillin-insensitive murein endopeptidase